MEKEYRYKPEHLRAIQAVEERLHEHCNKHGHSFPNIKYERITSCEYCGLVIER